MTFFMMFVSVSAILEYICPEQNLCQYSLKIKEKLVSANGNDLICLMKIFSMMKLIIVSALFAEFKASALWTNKFILHYPVNFF